MLTHLRVALVRGRRQTLARIVLWGTGVRCNTRRQRFRSQALNRAPLAITAKSPDQRPLMAFIGRGCANQAIVHHLVSLTRIDLHPFRR